MTIPLLNRKSNRLYGRGYISILGHITMEELQHLLSTTDVENGFANRFLWAFVRRSKKLPSGNGMDQVQLSGLGKQLRTAMDKARKVQRMRRTPAAEKRWAVFYNGLDDDVTGLVGAITARAEAQALRLSMVYALLDGKSRIDLPHLEAALAVWQYCEDSVKHLFGDATGDKITDRLLKGLRDAGPDGLDGKSQHQLFDRNVSAGKLESARHDLERRGLITTQNVPTDGRPRLVSRAVSKGVRTNELTNKGLGATVTSIDKAPTRRRRVKPSARGQS